MEIFPMRKQSKKRFSIWKTITWITVFSSLALLISGSAYGQGIETVLIKGGVEVLAGAVLDKTGSQLIQELRASGASLIGQGQNAGNALLIRMGNEMSVLADNSARILGDEADKTVRNMSSEFQPLMAAVVQASTNSKTLKDTAYKFKDSTVLDLRSIFTPITGEHFYIQRIEGISQLFKPETDYTVSIWGTGLGIPTNKVRSSIKISLNGKVLSAEPERVDAHISTFRIPNNVLKPLYKPKTISTANLEFQIVQDFKPWYAFWWSSNTYKVPVKLALIPKYAGTINVVTTVPRSDWVFVRKERSTLTSGDHNCAKCSDPPKAPYTLTIKASNSLRADPILGDQQLRNPILRCLPDVVDVSIMNQHLQVDRSACPWTSMTAPTLNENNSRAIGNFLVWGSPTNWDLTADLYEYKFQGDTKSEATYEMYFGDVLTIEVPNTQGVVAIGVGRTFTKEIFQVVMGTNNDYLALQSEVPGPVKKKILYVVKEPA
jgi:hypothetical protein